MTQPKWYFLYRALHLPSGAAFIGVHGSTDPFFGTEHSKDPWIGSGAKVIALARRDGRGSFLVQQIMAGTEEQCIARFKQIKVNYDHPLCLNMRPLDPTTPKSEEHKAAIAESTAIAMIGNENGLGNTGPDKTLPEGHILKWYNNGVKQQIIELDKDRKPVDSQFNDWVIGKLKKKSAVKKDIETV